MTSRSIVLGTWNKGKVREIVEVLSDLPVRIVDLGHCGDVDEPVEDGETFAANARIKALHYARSTGMWCLADDSGLVVDALGGAPGVHSARYACDEGAGRPGRDTIDAANNAKLLGALEDVDDEHRTARFVCHLTLADDQKVLIETSGVVQGRIIRVPRGQNGFGYDPLFYVEELSCTTAELSPAGKNAISHRGQAVRRFASLLTDFLVRSDGP